MCAQPVAQRPAQVLLVEDSRVQAMLVEMAVEELDLLELVHIAEDGEEALAYLRQEGDFLNAQRPDVILLDLNMPKMNGFEVLQEVKRDEFLRGIPVVMFTTSELEEDIAKAYEHGASTFFTKPADFDELVRTLEDFGRYWRSAKLAKALPVGT
jgi:CheY-like chemotaxis protein